jgi:hypothetical protein
MYFDFCLLLLFYSRVQNSISDPSSVSDASDFEHFSHETETLDEKSAASQLVEVRERRPLLLLNILIACNAVLLYSALLGMGKVLVMVEWIVTCRVRRKSGTLLGNSAILSQGSTWQPLPNPKLQMQSNSIPLKLISVGIRPISAPSSAINS